MEDERLKIEIGTKEPDKLRPSAVFIEETSIQQVMNTYGKKVGEKVVFRCKHPDRDELIEISKTKYLKGEKLTESGIWFNLDEDGKVLKKSALSQVLGHYEAKNLEEMNKKSVDAVEDEGGYLCVKAY